MDSRVVAEYASTFCAAIGAWAQFDNGTGFQFAQSEIFDRLQWLFGNDEADQKTKAGGDPWTNAYTFSVVTIILNALGLFHNFTMAYLAKKTKDAEAKARQQKADKFVEEYEERMKKAETLQEENAKLLERIQQLEKSTINLTNLESNEASFPFRFQTVVNDVQAIKRRLDQQDDKINQLVAQFSYHHKIIANEEKIAEIYEVVKDLQNTGNN